ncbi:hypothetical protein HDV06_002425 [Boothiomyces sp. JEL0866]|nr:hypothetical protein HDV06_002425 [Boothiomyces sp. JEL0866]
MIKKHLNKNSLDAAKLFICSGSLVLLFLGNIAEISYIEGPSMIPTANSGDLLLWDKISVLWKPYEIGELVVYRSPIDKNRVVLKRILGLPGDTIYTDPTKSNERIIVPEGHVWVQGDNYDMSRDSREYGAFSMGLLLGRVRFPIISFLEKQDGQERKLIEMEQKMEEYFNQLNYKIDALIKKQLRSPMEPTIATVPTAAPAAEPEAEPLIPSLPPPPPPPPPVINTDTSIKITKSNKPLPKQEMGMGTVLQELSSRSATLRRSARILQQFRKAYDLQEEE